MSVNSRSVPRLLGVLVAAALAACTTSDGSSADLGRDLGRDICVWPGGDYFVKALFVIDTSGSMQFTDPSSEATEAMADCLAACSANTSGLDCDALCKRAGAPGRQAAVAKAIELLAKQPATSVSVIAFNATTTVSGGPSEALIAPSDSAGVAAALDSLLRAELTTDYQSALTAAVRVLEQDMLLSTAAERLRTKYVVLFVSDGEPSPICKAGCGNDTIKVGASEIANWCDVRRDKWCDHFGASPALCTAMESWYPAMRGDCREYNSDAQLVKLTTDLVGLEARYGVGEIRLHAGLLFDASLPKSVLDLFYDPALSAKEQQADAEALLQQLATAGGGRYWRFDSGREIAFPADLFTPIDPCAPKP